MTLGTSSTNTSYAASNTEGGSPTAIVCVAVTLPSSASAATQIAAAPTFALVLGGAQGV